MSARQTILLVVAWWFVLVGGYGAGRVVGPFPSEAICEQMRRQFVIHFVSVCWNDGQ